MDHEFTAIIEKDEDWRVGYRPEIPGANGQGKRSRSVSSIWRRQLR